MDAGSEVERDRLRMVSLLEGLGAPEGARATTLEGVLLMRTTCRMLPVPTLYEPCIVIVAQGVKRFHLPDRVVQYDARHYLMLTVPVPGECETEVGDDGPFLGMAVRVDLGLLSELLMTMAAPACAARAKQRVEWVSAPPMHPALSNVAIRLLQCLHSPTDAKVLGPQLVRELMYRVLCGQQGGTLTDLLLRDGAQAQIHRILHRMHMAYAAPLRVDALAHEAGMSVSALHAHFKAVTATSPMQYLKTIRLHKARLLMAQEALGAALAAERVGYESSSQFSREFKRLFGRPPADEARYMKGVFGAAMRDATSSL